MLDDAYEAIVSESGRPVLVLAGPGAGKTYLLGDRVKRLLSQGVPSSSITVLAFGRDASQNMSSKLMDPQDGFGIPYKELPRVCTMHALANEILHRAPRKVGLRKESLEVQPNEDARRLLFRDSALSVGLSEDDGANARHCKEWGCQGRGTRDIECKVCERYWAIMAKCNLVDYDDQLLFACEILSRDPEMLAEYQAGAQHLLVDEYQDINAAQFRLIEMLSRESRPGLFAVGDDAQSIYGFRGGDPRYILNFERDYKGALVAPLAHSRRCPEAIMAPASAALKPHYPEWKGPFTLQYHSHTEKHPVVWQVPSDEAEASIVARMAKEAAAKKKTMLVLAPRKDFFPRISFALCQWGIAHQRPANMLPKAVNDRLEVVLPILRWLQSPVNSFLVRLALEVVLSHGIAKVPGAVKGKRCKPETLEHRKAVETEVASLWDGVSSKRSLWECLLGLPDTSSREIRQAKEVMRGLLEAHGSSKGDLKGEFAKRLALAAGAWMEAAHCVEDICSIDDVLSNEPPTGFSLIQLITMKKAKGLEADVVVMVGLEDDILPNPMSPIEEEARLFYVSMTRAKESLIMLHSYSRKRNISFGPEIANKPRSRFLNATGIESEYKKI